MNPDTYYPGLVRPKQMEVRNNLLHYEWETAFYTFKTSGENICYPRDKNTLKPPSTNGLANLEVYLPFSNLSFLPGYDTSQRAISRTKLLYRNPETLRGYLSTQSMVSLARINFPMEVYKSLPHKPENFAQWLISNLKKHNKL